MRTPSQRLFAVLLLGFTSLASLRAAEDVTTEEDVVYGHKDGMALTFDVVKPAKPNGAGLLWMQSGGWYSPWMDAKIWPSWPVL